MTSSEASSASAMPAADSSGQLARTQASYDRLRQQMATLQDNNAQLEARIDREIASKGRIQAQLAALQESSAGFEATAEDMTAEVESLRSQRKDRVRQILDLQRQAGAASTSTASTEMTSDMTMDASADMAKIQSERNIAVQRIAELRGQINAMQSDMAGQADGVEAMQAERDSALETVGDLATQLSTLKSDMETQAGSAAKVQMERDIAVQRIGELRGDFAAQQEASASELARAVKLGDRARAQRTAALEKLKAMQSMKSMQESSSMEATPVTEPASLESSQAGALESLELYQTLATRLGAGETLSAEEQTQYNNALAALTANQKIVAEQIGGTTYTVVEGDNLSAIAQQVYGDGNSYQKILEANNYLIDDADLIFPGFELVIPK